MTPGDVDLECWFCGAAFARPEIERDALLIPRRHDEGGPYLSYACAGCKRPSRVERNRAGAWLASPRPPVPIVDFLLSLLDRELARELARKQEHARKRAGRRAWFLGPYSDELVATGWRPGDARPVEGGPPDGVDETVREGPAHAPGSDGPDDGARPGAPRRDPPPRDRSSRPPREPTPPPPPPEPAAPSPRAPHDVLGVPPGAPPEVVDRAFRELAKRYHPDRFAVLDADFQALADRRMRELLAARDALLPPR